MLGQPDLELFALVEQQVGQLVELLLAFIGHFFVLLLEIVQELHHWNKLFLSHFFQNQLDGGVESQRTFQRTYLELELVVVALQLKTVFEKLGFLFRIRLEQQKGEEFQQTALDAFPMLLSVQVLDCCPSQFLRVFEVVQQPQVN